MNNISLVPFENQHRAALKAVRVRDDQVQFSGQPEDVIDIALSNLDIHVILDGSAPVGMFRIDKNYHQDHIFADSTALGLRTFLIDQAHQGRGIAKTVASQLKEYLSHQYPTKTAVILTVNLRNSVAKNIYLHGGFIDTDAQYMAGLVGPQHILKLPLI